MNINPTHHPDVNEILDFLLRKVSEILKDQLVGMYLFGSLANGGFDKDSDIDILFVTKAEIANEIIPALRTMHEKISTLDSPWACQLEVSYIPVKPLRRYDPSSNKHPHLDRGKGEKLRIMQHDSDWIIQRFILRERGITIIGPDTKSLIDLVSSGDLKLAVVDIMNSWIKGFLNDACILSTCGYQSYTVLTLCRILHTFRYGTIVSKPIAADWARENLDQRWKPLIKRAWIGRQNPGTLAGQEDIKATLEMIKYVINLTTPTLYGDVNQILNMLLSNVKEILQDQFVGMYLYGSLASGDFNPETSDIDFLVVTVSSLSEETIVKLEAMHKQAWATSPKRTGKLEGSYVPRDLIRCHDPDGAPYPTINEGKFFVDKRGSDGIIQRHVIREYGVIVEGPDPKTLIEFVSPDDIRDAVMGSLNEWWFPMLDDPAWLRNGENGDRAFAVVTMCRVLHTLEHGTIVSKPKATQWAQTRLDERWRQLIDKAVTLSNRPEQVITLDETLDFIRFIKEQTVGSHS